MILCKSHPHEYVTTMFDYYAMPSDTPGTTAQDVALRERSVPTAVIIAEQ